MSFKLKKLRKVVSSPVKVVKAVAKNKTVQAVGRGYLAMQTGGASEMALGRLQMMKNSDAGQAVSSIASDLNSQVTAPVTEALSSTTAQANAVVNTPKNRDKESFVERISESFSGAGQAVGGGSKKMIFAVVGGVVLLFFFLKRKK